MSAEEKAKENEAYLTEWIRRAEVVRDLIPEVQKQREIAACDVSGAAALDRSAPTEIARHAERSLTRRLDTLRRTLPQPIAFYGNLPSTVETSTSSAASSTVIFTSLVELQSGPRVSLDVDEAVRRYLELQRKQDRINEARSRLATHLAPLVLLFDQAEKAFAMAQIDAMDVPKAAGEMRTLLDKIKGELLARARRTPNENAFSWQTIAERLTVGRDASLREALLDEENHRRHLTDELSKLLKRRGPADIDRLAAAWAGVVNHLYVVCGCL